MALEKLLTTNDEEAVNARAKEIQAEISDDGIKEKLADALANIEFLQNLLLECFRCIDVNQQAIIMQGGAYNSLATYLERCVFERNGIDNQIFTRVNVPTITDVEKMIAETE